MNILLWSLKLILYYKLQDLYINDCDLWIHDGEVKKNATKWDSLTIGKILSKDELNEFLYVLKN